MTSLKNLSDRILNYGGACFGNEFNRYVPVVRSVLDRTASQVYSFMPIEKFLASGPDPAEINRIYWTEMLGRVHLASCTSLRRNLGWMEAVLVCYEANNYLGFTASLRALIESIGDSADVLSKMPKNVAKDHSIIIRCVRGEERNQGVASQEMEDELIGYSHARSVRKGEHVPKSHIAKPTSFYINLLEQQAGLSGLADLYRELCDVMHPGASSVHYQFLGELSACGHAMYKSRPMADAFNIQRISAEWKDNIRALVYLGFDPALVTLKVLHKFGLFPRLPELRKFDFTLQKLANDSMALLKR